MIELDGSHGEGGGQIIRTALALSAVTGHPFSIKNIRANRPNPGLQAQHLNAVSAVALLCSAKTDARLGAKSMAFEPGKIKSGDYKIDIGTAGAISLVIQPFILASTKAGGPVSMRITGGTHVSWSPTIDYMKTVFEFYMKKIGVASEIQLLRRGFYPKGGGIVKLSVNPGKIIPLVAVERSEFRGCDLISVASEDLKPASVAERQAEAFVKAVKVNESVIHYDQSASSGSALLAHAHYGSCLLGASALGKQGKPAEKVGEEAALGIKRLMESGACLDGYMADQILPFMALAEGKSRIWVSDITDHVKTNIWVIEQFVDAKFTVKGSVIEVSP